MSDTLYYNSVTRELFAKGEHHTYPGGLGKFYYDRMKYLATKGAIAQIDAASGKHQSYNELFQISVKLATYLRSVGIKATDVIALCCYNHIHAAAAAIATFLIGAIPASTDPTLPMDDTIYLLGMVKPKIAFVSDGSEELIEGAIEALGLPAKLIALEEHVKFEYVHRIVLQTEFKEDFIPHFVDNFDDTFAILFSSGTTGLPKGIMLSHNYFFCALGKFDYMDPILQIVYLNYSSFYWISSVLTLAFCIRSGIIRLLCRSFNPEYHWSISEKYNVNAMALSNTYAVEALPYLKDGIHLPKLDSIKVAGGLVVESVLYEYKKKLPNTITSYIYALTESGLISDNQAGDPISSAGKPIFNNQILKIVDPETEESLPLNKIGELRVKRKYQMTGYFNMDDSIAWDSEGFLKTGDLAFINDDCNLFIVDRIKEMFKYRSWHVVPAKIENIFGAMPEILYVVVLGKPTYNEDENHAMAVVCLKNGATTTAQEIERFANERLGEIDQIRAGVHIVEQKDFVLTPTGKINRRQMKQKYAPKIY